MKQDDEDEEGFLEASTFYYLSKGKREEIKVFSQDNINWEKMYYSEVNFLIEFCDSIFLIEANSVTIKDKKFTNLMTLI